MAREQDTSCFLGFPEHSAILKFGLPVSNGHTEAPGPTSCGGLLGPWAPPLIQGAQCLCPCPGAPDGDPCGSRRTPLPRKPRGGTSGSGVTPQSQSCFSSAASGQVSPDDPAHRRKQAGNRQRLENGKDQNFPEGETLNVLVLSLRKPVWLVWCPWAPAPCVAPALKKATLGRKGGGRHGESTAVKARGLLRGGHLGQGLRRRRDCLQATVGEQEGAEGGLPLSRRTALQARGHSLQSDLGKPRPCLPGEAGLQAGGSVPPPPMTAPWPASTSSTISHLPPPSPSTHREAQGHAEAASRP